MKKIQEQFKNITLAVILIAFSSTAYGQNVPEKDVKTNVVGITNALVKLKNLTPVTFEYADKYKQYYPEKGKQYSFLADSFQTVFPEMVYDKRVSYMFGKNQYRDIVVKTVDYERLVPVLVASIKELEAEIQKLKIELARTRGSSKP